MCDRCNLFADTITHRFWTCQEVQIFWRNVEELLQRMRIPDISILNKRVILCGCLKSLAVNHIIMLGKIMISKNISLSIKVLLAMIKLDLRAEKTIALKRGKTSDYDNKWEPVLAFLEESWGRCFDPVEQFEGGLHGNWTPMTVVCSVISWFCGLGIVDDDRALYKLDWWLLGWVWYGIVYCMVWYDLWYGVVLYMVWCGIVIWYGRL